MPFSVNRTRDVLYFLGTAVCLIAFYFYFAEYRTTDWDNASLKLFMRVFYVALSVSVCIPLLPRCFGRLHILPGGISVTLLGLTIRRFPAEEIRFLGGVMYRRKSTRKPLIAVCDASLEELARRQGTRDQGKADWMEKAAGRYLFLRATSTLRDFGIEKKGILWLEWSPERLQVLRRLYPRAQWADLTEKKILDEERGIFTRPTR